MSRADLRPALLSAAATLAAISAVHAAAFIEVVQQGRAFSVAELRAHRGQIIRFSNEDEFDHQVYVASPAFPFDSDESSPGQKLEMTLTAAGTFEVRCHIHPRMHLSVVVD